MTVLGGQSGPKCLVLGVKADARRLGLLWG